MILKKKFRKVIPKHINTVESLRLGIILAIVGGFIDVYTYISRGGVFANSETGNVVLAAIGLADKDYKMAFNALMQLVFFILGALVSEFFRYRRDKENKNEVYHAKRILIIEAIVLFCVGFIKEDAPNILVNATISFISSIQISAFTTLVDSPYSSTICTGNLRQLGENFFKAINTKDKIIRARFLRYLIIIIFFAFGAILGGYLTRLIGVKSIFVAVIFVLLAYGVFYYDNYKNNKQINK